MKAVKTTESARKAMNAWKYGLITAVSTARYTKRCKLELQSRNTLHMYIAVATVGEYSVFRGAT